MSVWESIKSNPIIVSALTALIMWIAGWVRVFLAKRVRVHNPDSEKIAKIVPAINMLIEMKEPELDMLIALGEAIHGHNNSNVEIALDSTREARSKYRKYLGKSACIEVEK